MEDFTLLRGGLRRLWNRWPVKTNALKAWQFKHSFNGKKPQWAIRCRGCGKTLPKSKVSVDHIVPAGSLNQPEDIGPFVQRLLMVTEDDLQPLCTDKCHPLKTYRERYGVGEAEARVALAMAPIRKLKVAELRRLLDRQGLHSSGTKPKLLDRYAAHLLAQQ